MRLRGRRRVSCDLAALASSLAEVSRAQGLLLRRLTDVWQRFAATPMNERQIKLINRLLDGFEGKLTTSKWATVAKCSADTSLRDINELVTLGVLRRSASGGRSTSDELSELPEVSGGATRAFKRRRTGFAGKRARALIGQG